MAEKKFKHLKLKAGDEVTIKEGFHKGDWGIVKLIDEDNMIHVAIFGDSNDCPMFTRSELTKKSQKAM